MFISSTKLLSPNSCFKRARTVDHNYHFQNEPNWCEWQNSKVSLEILLQGQNFNNAIISESLDSYKIPFFVDQNR